MKCPYCGFEESKVVDSRAAEDNTSIRRRRECLQCTKRYTTYEKIEDLPILVIKKDFTRENFNKEKIINGLIIACQKRPVSRKQIEDIAADIEKTVSNSMLTEVPTNDIGEMVMARLKEIDEISYVRFASVYRQFKDINTFLDEIKNLIK
ncbi:MULTISPECIES: transcriptional regulator NrdR [Clostridium]|jgi:transcriptional repressor NrdR|uniref:Transcriptional repressor NrdR n=1 Tax=Clostridium saccharoperbutylacetonicum N1-4(HMT) TaxID=931276 RepID=M1MAQ3_9CLOT|nr:MULTISPECIES: transcriptional regulator NrdR [Clostridium]AGF55034.1 transcriptional repressor NrdR [Clostridium saccharoperbutylacetonicum N1-4(HMT)]AQR93923.1 transcriptional repressor NrdR [Clostridium saccharoperbutylacetonicum]NRT64257.1 transcriptional repressor NrdR [Clostridium saccharoperbutylacetonicum]NSB27625.1 transcriptional repressor NrdR [Clostridium saccharoperbutylacetonicum]NSB29621.1 transcriptional repressor NrdR [Clostridium saccharoperbutylacetonicum]